jgi:NAD(P)-dependent dehydrogenase (short-subunit alcohol dehydrogenase family)
MPEVRPNPLDNLLDKTVLFSYNRLGYALRRKGWNDADLQIDMRGKICLVTGATGGLGYVTAQKLAALGATVYIVGRDWMRSQAARDRIVKATGNPNVKFELADLSSLQATRGLAENFLAKEDRLDVLVNNAGVLLHEREDSVDGIELTFATNVLSGFLLTYLLSPVLVSTAPSRVIFVSSGGMYARKLNPDDLQFEKETYSGLAAYAQSKRAQVILSEIFAERLAASGVAVNSMHPGWVDTPGIQKSLPGFKKLMNISLRTPEQGADTIVWLAVAPGLQSESGKFWFDRRPRPTHKVSRTQNTPEERQQLWNECLRLSGFEEQV